MRITDQLLVSRAEHNEGHLPTLEEISLHQQKLEKIEYINRVCADLKILQLQDNCIERMENLGRLRKLEYLNLAMNSIEKIENTEPLEKLEKLDLTLNFIGELSSIRVLGLNNQNLKSLFLMGNPCTQFDHYRDYVIALLPQLEFLDGTPIGKSERISAHQRLQQITPLILAQEEKYLIQREKEKQQNMMEVQEKSKEYDDPNLDLDEQRRKFYQSQSKHNPEYRKESQRFRQYLEEQDSNDQSSSSEPLMKKRPRRLFDNQGKALNINEANVDFHYNDSDEHNIVIQIMTYKFMDSSFIDLDVQPTYLRAKIKGKIFQLRFLEEVQPDAGKAERSQTTGHLMVTLPRVKDIITPAAKAQTKKTLPTSEKTVRKNRKDRDWLEITPNDTADFTRIVQDANEMPALELI